MTGIIGLYRRDIKKRKLKKIKLTDTELRRELELIKLKANTRSARERRVIILQAKERGIE